MDVTARRDRVSSRRTWFRQIGGVVAGAGALRLASWQPHAAVAQGRSGAVAPGQGGGNAVPEGTALVLLGTQAGPGVSLARAQTASVIVAGGRPYLVDCGYGALRGLVQAGLRIADVADVFVSHLHNDHTADIAALLSMKWTGT